MAILYGTERYPYFTPEGFGWNPPVNVNDICDQLNEIAEKEIEKWESKWGPLEDDIHGDVELKELINDIWEKYCQGKLAVDECQYGEEQEEE